MSLRGRRVKYITVEEKTETRTSSGSVSYGWQPATFSEADASGGIYAEQHFKGGDEADENGQIIAYQNVIWKIPVLEGLNSSDNRIRYDSKIYNIVDVWYEGRANMMIKTTQKDNR